MPEKAQRQLQLEQKLKASNRKQLLSGLVSFIIFTTLLVSFDSFDEFYEYSRSHEDWDLDEWVLGLFAALFTTAITFAMSTWRYNRILEQEIEYQVKLEHELAQAQKMQSLGTLAGGIAHSTNNHLQPIQTLSRLSKKQLPDDHPLQPLMDKILQASEHAQSVLGQLLRFSHQENREKPLCDLQHELQENSTLYQSAITYSDQLQLQLDNHPCPIGLTTSESADILLALITNAEDSYENKNGPIFVTLRRLDNQVELKVSDKGCGMDEAQQQRIFEPFYTSKAVGKGTGLGLSVVHGLVQQVEGSISVSSSPGEGSEFTIRFPLADKATKTKQVS